MAPFNLWPLLFLTLPILVWLLDGVAVESNRRLRNAAIVGWSFGFGFFAAGLYWIAYSFLVEADKFAWMLPIAMTVLPAGLALFYALAATGAMLVWRGGARRIFAIAIMLFAAEWLRGHVLTGFPWNLWGYALCGNDVLAQTTALFGIYGLTLIALVIFASPAAFGGLLVRPNARNWVLPALCLALLAGSWGWGYTRLANAVQAFQPGVKLRVVQGNVPQAEKWKPENRRQIFEQMLTLSSGPTSGGDITHIIWPESSVPFLLLLNKQILFVDVRNAFAPVIGNKVLILGGDRAEGVVQADGRLHADAVYNSLIVLGKEASVHAIYDKVHLVPFGEYLPLEKLLISFGFKELTNTGYTSGTNHPLIETDGAPPFLPLICYEVIFPDMLNHPIRPTWIVNLTNDSWYGNSTGPYQHLLQARVRAIETGLPLVRAANTGISAIIDPYGRIIASQPLNTMGVIDEALPAALTQTPYARWWEMSLIAVALLVYLLYRFVITVE
jgi:apolipoprotein N-acyltransferase